MKQVFLFVIGLVLFQTVYSQTEKTDNWNNDLDHLAKVLSKKHYNFFTIRNKEDFFSGITAIKLETKNLNDFQIALKTQQLIAKFGDSHTMLNYSQMYDRNQILPIRLLWTSDGLHILHTTLENKELLGGQLLSINKVPITTIIDSLSTMATIDNQATIKVLIPQVLFSFQVLEYFGFTDTKQVELEVKTNTNQNLVYVLEPLEMNQNNRISFKSDSVSFCMKNANTFFTDFYYPDEKIYYMLYNRCWSREIERFRNRKRAKTMPSFKDFKEKAFNVLENKPVEKIIFDMRFNGGGNSIQGTRFIKKLSKFLKANPTIKTYVVLGSSTFSSAILNAMDFKRLTNAIFVGEETAGKPNHFGEVKSFQLPNSKLYVSYSTKYFKKTDENVSTIKPDIVIEMSFSDFTKGIDPIYEWVKKQ